VPVRRFAGTGTTSDDERSAGMLDVAAPLHANGAWAQGWFENASSRMTDSSVSGPQGMQRTTTWSQRADAVRPSFATGALDADPLGSVWSSVDSRG
jgi:hypothetical protein